jgi:CubicO group peptidase (beta-lactamase class C family)
VTSASIGQSPSERRRLDAAAVANIVDPHFDRALDAGVAPGIAYTVLADGEVIHSRGLGTIALDEPQIPDEHTAFRIASMTKSFTAAVVLSLRDEALLTLDSPVVEWVPELAVGGDAATITVRHLLTMAAGFATDDPWGDRQQALDISAFRALLRRGVTPVFRPGDRFEYSNMGYAILGLVISDITGLSYGDAVRQLVLAPLGMSETGFTPRELSTASVATGYVKRSTGWQIEPIAASGAFSPMGGVISTLSDLALWVNFLSGDHADAGVMSDVSLREMKRTQRLVAASSPTAVDEAVPAPTVTGYGFGLFEDFRPWGRSVFHSGGYPGFGSHMRWHPASGLAVIALANGTYAPMSTTALNAMATAVGELDVPTTVAWPQAEGLDRALAAVRAWLAADDPNGPAGDSLRRLWSDNVEQDLPWGERVSAWESLRREKGPFERLRGRSAEWGRAQLPGIWRPARAQAARRTAQEAIWCASPSWWPLTTPRSCSH